ncbi:MAG: alpha/beta fold hydrolase [Burkholderiaceae bacterium]
MPDFASMWGPFAQQFQQALQGGGVQAAAGIAGSSLPALAFDAAKLEQLQQTYLEQATALWNQGLQANPVLQDKRFATPAWSHNPVSAFSAALYSLNSSTLMGLADALQADEKTRGRIRFATEQMLAATAPSNYMALNAEAQEKAIASKGESIAKGLKNLLHDLRQGHVSQTDEAQFEVGKNVATTEGAVVFENALFQLIEYKPIADADTAALPAKTSPRGKTASGAQVFERPFLFVPPCINKFYILDLQPENSLIRHVVLQGHRTFVVSWRNVDESMAKTTWDEYIQDAAIKAIDVIREITGAEKINALGFCVGGTILSTALAVLAARGQGGPKSPVASLTLLTTLLDFSDTGVLDLFIDEGFVKLREMQMGKGGLLKGQELATTFSFLRPNDLVWNYVVGNYLKGETPPPFDLLYWNSDATNLPGPMYCWYLRHTYHENSLCQPGMARVCGEKIDLFKINLPTYVYGSRDDHIVPVGGAYANTQHLAGPIRFVMGASGHIAGVINPPAKKKRSHWLREQLPAQGFPASLDQWLSGATEHPGSWWTDWTAWLAGHGGEKIAAPKDYGSAKYKAIEPAPGRYVKAKSD